MVRLSLKPKELVASAHVGGFCTRCEGEEQKVGDGAANCYFQMKEHSFCVDINPQYDFNLEIEGKNVSWNA